MAKTLLTVRKTAWVNKFKPNVIKGIALSPNAAVAARYHAALIPMIQRMTEETERQIKRLFNGETGEEFFAEDASISSQARILTNALQRKFDKMFAGSAQRVAEAFMNQSDKTSSAALHSSIQQLSGGLSLPTTSLKGPIMDVFNASVVENVALIKSIPQKYLNGVQQAVMRSITTGNGLEDLVPYLAKNKGITLRRARMIASDQTAKAFNSLSKARMQSIGVKRYEWLHSGGSNAPRKEHIVMSGNIYSFEDPPVIDSKTGERGIPGQLPNCRCLMKPVIEFDNAT